MSRLLVGYDQGIATASTTTAHPRRRSAPRRSPTGVANGNLQITQFYNGAAQPSALAAQVAGALFYGMAQDDGFPASDPNVLNNGDIGWFGPTGDGTDVVTDETGSGTTYETQWPCCKHDRLGPNEFFQVNGIGRTFGLLQSTSVPPGPSLPGTSDPQWPYGPSYNFAVNPVDSQEMIIGSGAGRLFGTQDEGVIWTELAEPSVFDSTTIPALAYGAPDPGAPPARPSATTCSSGPPAATSTSPSPAAAAAAATAWTNISAGLDGSPVQRIVTDPTRGTFDAYAITSTGVFYNPNTSAAGSTWTNITGDLFEQTTTPFGDAEPDAQALLRPRRPGRRLAVRHPVRPDRPEQGRTPTRCSTSAGVGGVFRSTNNGTNWTAFPDQTLATPVAERQPADVDGLRPRHGPGQRRPDDRPPQRLDRAEPPAGDDLRQRLLRHPPGADRLQRQHQQGRRDAEHHHRRAHLQRPERAERLRHGRGGHRRGRHRPEQPDLPRRVQRRPTATSPRPARRSTTRPTRPTSTASSASRAATPTPPANSDPFFYDGTRTIEIFATDASGTKGNIVTFQITNNVPTPAAPVFVNAAPPLRRSSAPWSRAGTSSRPRRRRTSRSPSRTPASARRSTVNLVRVDSQGNATTVATDQPERGRHGGHADRARPGPERPVGDLHLRVSPTPSRSTASRRPARRARRRSSGRPRRDGRPEPVRRLGDPGRRHHQRHPAPDRRHAVPNHDGAGGTVDAGLTLQPSSPRAGGLGADRRDRPRLGGRPGQRLVSPPARGPAGGRDVRPDRPGQGRLSATSSGRPPDADDQHRRADAGPDAGPAAGLRTSRTTRTPRARRSSASRPSTA